MTSAKRKSQKHLSGLYTHCFARVSKRVKSFHTLLTLLTAGGCSNVEWGPPCCDLPDLRKALEGSLWHVDGVVQGDHVRFAVDPQH